MAVSSRRQYLQVANAIAKVMARTDLPVYDRGGNAQMALLVEVLCSTYAKDNPSFDAERFREACYRIEGRE